MQPASSLDKKPRTYIFITINIVLDEFQLVTHLSTRRNDKTTTTTGQIPLKRELAQDNYYHQTALPNGQITKWWHIREIGSGWGFLRRSCPLVGGRVASALDRSRNGNRWKEKCDGGLHRYALRSMSLRFHDNLTCIICFQLAQIVQDDVGVCVGDLGLWETVGGGWLVGLI